MHNAPNMLNENNLVINEAPPSENRKVKADRHKKYYHLTAESSKKKSSTLKKLQAALFEKLFNKHYFLEHIAEHACTNS